MHKELSRAQGDPWAYFGLFPAYLNTVWKGPSILTAERCPAAAHMRRDDLLRLWLGYIMAGKVPRYWRLLERLFLRKLGFLPVSCSAHLPQSGQIEANDCFSSLSLSTIGYLFAPLKVYFFPFCFLLYVTKWSEIFF